MRQKITLPKLPKGFRLEHNPGRPKPFRVVRPVDGRRVRESFATEREARTALDAAVAAFLRHGVAAVEWDSRAYAEWKEARRILGDRAVTLPEVAAFWLRHGARDCVEVETAEAVSSFLDDKRAQGRSERHTGDLDSRLGAFALAFKGRGVGSLTSRDVLAWLKAEGGSARSHKNNLGAVMNFLRYAQRRNWIHEVPAVHESDLPARKPPSKGILTVEQTRGVFAWVEAHRPRWCAWFAIQAFAGIRNAEACRFRWEFVDFARRRIVVPKDICKTGDDWVLVGLPANLWAWLDAYRQDSGKLAAPGDRALDVVRERLVAAGIIPAWPANALRHSFATYHISLHESADKTALMTRHTNAATLMGHYVKHLVEKSVATGYFGIRPGP